MTPPAFGFTWWEIFMLIGVTIGIPLLTPAIIGMIAGDMIRGSSGLAGIGIGLLAGLAAIGIWMLTGWIAIEYFDLTELLFVLNFIGASTLLCSAVTVGILWLIRSDQTTTPPHETDS